MKITKLSVVFSAVFAAIASCGAAHGALIVGQQQFNSGDVLPSPITAVSGDLLETSVASFTGENSSANVRNGTTGTAQANDGTNPAVVWGQGQTTYVFNTSVNTLGYNISEIRLFSGWMDGRAGQSYSIDYSLVGAPNTFIPLGTVSAPVSDGSLLTRTYDSTGANILTGVAAIQFNQIDNDLAGSGTVFREFDVLGSPTLPAPEPTSLATLCGLSAMGLLLFLRRGRT
jgi:hypothetical protein